MSNFPNISSSILTGALDEHYLLNIDASLLSQLAVFCNDAIIGEKINWWEAYKLFCIFESIRSDSCKWAVIYKRLKRVKLLQYSENQTNKGRCLFFYVI